MDLTLLLPIGLLVAFLAYTFFKNKKTAQARKEEVENKLKPGTWVVTRGGVFGLITHVDHEQQPQQQALRSRTQPQNSGSVVLKVAPEIEMTFMQEGIGKYLDVSEVPASIKNKISVDSVENKTQSLENLESSRDDEIKPQKTSDYESDQKKGN